MPPRKPKARMACSMENAAKFLEKQNEIKADCEELLKVHVDKNPDVEWKPEDGAGPQANLRREKARLKLALSLNYDEETGRPRFPPPNTRLSDELVYLAVKHMKCTLRGQRYPYDFDKKGDIDADRVPSGPPPIIWAHGLPFFPVYKGYYILCGRTHATCIGWLIEEKTRKIMQRSPTLSIGSVIAPKSAVESEHNIDRQISLHQPYGTERDLRFKGKPEARDVVSAFHNECAILPRLDEDSQVIPLWKVLGYNARCGPPYPGFWPTLMREEFFVEHGLENNDQYAYLIREYSNLYAEGSEEPKDISTMATALTETATTENATAENDDSLFVDQSEERQDMGMFEMEQGPEEIETDNIAEANLQPGGILPDNPATVPEFDRLPDFSSVADIEQDARLSYATKSIPEGTKEPTCPQSSEETRPGFSFGGSMGNPFTEHDFEPEIFAMINAAEIAVIETPIVSELQDITQLSGTEDTNAQEAEAQETDTQEMDAEETDSQEMESEDTDAQETDNQETDDQEMEFEDTDAQETDNQETDAQETDAQETDAQETDAQETDAQETDIQETYKTYGQIQDHIAWMEIHNIGSSAGIAEEHDTEIRMNCSENDEARLDGIIERIVEDAKDPQLYADDEY